MNIIIIFLSTFLLSTALFIFWVVKGGFNRKFLYTDNVLLALVASVITAFIYSVARAPLWIITPIISGLIVLLLFIALFFYRFFRNPARQIPGNPNDIVSGADGRIIYIKELEENQLPVSVKKLRISDLSEVTKTDIVKRPCYHIGIAMTLFDVHVNRAPIDGEIILVKHTDGTAIGLNTPTSTITNERNTVVIKREDGILVGIVQIAARFVSRCIISSKQGDKVRRGEVIGKIRWGSQLDMIIPRNVEIMVREGEQVFAGKTIIGRLLE